VKDVEILAEIWVELAQINASLRVIATEHIAKEDSAADFTPDGFLNAQARLAREIRLRVADPEA
jgi:hypothetical protein